MLSTLISRDRQHHIIVDVSPYGVPFSHLFTELQISAIDLQISPNEL